MKFMRIYRETRLVWKQEINISNGILHEDGGGYFPLLSESWDKAQELSMNWSEWHQLMVWCVFNGYHRLAVNNVEQGKENIRFEDIDKRYVEKRFSEHLANPDSGYGRQMRRAYKNDLKTSKGS